MGKKWALVLLVVLLVLVVGACREPASKEVVTGVAIRYQSAGSRGVRIEIRDTLPTGFWQIYFYYLADGVDLPPLGRQCVFHYLQSTYRTITSYECED